MKIGKRAFGIVGTVLILNIIFTWLVVRKNDGKKYLNTYLSQQQQVKVLVSGKYFEEQFDHTNYFKKMIFYKAIFGGSRDFIFIDTYSNKYFRIMRFDEYEKKAGSQQTYGIEEEELYVMVDSVQYKDPTYGTLEKPYVVFSYKAVNKKLMMTINNWDKKDERGYYVKEEVPLAPSEKEYRYNAEQYLTYVMPKKEFKQRFCK